MGHNFQNDLWLLVSAALVLAGLLASQGLLLVVGSLVLIIRLTIGLWERHAFRKVSHSRIISRNRAFIGDSLEYSITLSNDKVLPLIWVDIQDTFPDGLELYGATMLASPTEGTQQHTITTSLLPFQQVTWTYRLRCKVRGNHRIGPVRLRSGDIFGFSDSETRFEELDNLLVYPRVVDLHQLNLPMEHPLGEGRGRRPLYRDTTRFVGQRDYSPTDPMKHIDWKATARTTKLQTKVFDPAVSLNVLVAFNANTGDNPWETSNHRLFERGVTIAASVAHYAARQGYTFGLVSNAVATHLAKYTRVPLGASDSQIILVLEALAMAGPYSVTTLPEVLRGERDSLPVGATLVFVTAVITPSLAQELDEMRERGFRVMVLYAGDGPPEMDLPGVPLTLVGSVADFADDVMEEHEPVLAD